MDADVQTAATTGSRFPVQKRALWIPIVVLESYLAFTVLLFFFGPVNWDLPSAPKLLSFLVVNYGGLWVGYRWGIRRGRRLLALAGPAEGGIGAVPPWVRKLILVSMLFTICSTTLRLFAIRGGLEPVLETVTNPGEAYIQAQLIAQMDRDKVAMPIEGYSWAFRISTVLAVLNSLYFPVAIVCWRWLPVVYRLLFLAAVFCTLIFSVGVGAQSGIGFMVFSLLPVALYKMYIGAPSRKQSDAEARRKTRRTALVIGASLCLLMAAVVFFQVDRAESSGQDLDQGDALVSAFGTPTTRGFALFGDGRLNYGVAMLCKYVSHGYEGLALSMELPFEWTYGLGWSKALQVILHDYLGGPDLFETSYLARNEAVNGWPALSWWSTIFPWIASDTTYFGTVAAMLLVGFVIGRLWMSVIVTANPLGFAVLAQMFTLVFMFPANNALAQTLEGLFALIGVAIIYLMSTRHFKPAKSPDPKA